MISVFGKLKMMWDAGQDGAPSPDEPNAERAWVSHQPGLQKETQAQKTIIDSWENTCNLCKVFPGGFKSHTQNQDVKYVVDA